MREGVQNSQQQDCRLFCRAVIAYWDFSQKSPCDLQYLCYLINMRLVNIRKSCHLLALFLLVFQFCGLIFCGDADCLQGGSTENCAALICNLLGKHSAPASTADNTQSSSCQCYCHGLIDLPKITLDAVPFATAPFHAKEALLLVSSPIHSIYHPPLV